MVYIIVYLFNRFRVRIISNIDGVGRKFLIIDLDKFAIPQNPIFKLDVKRLVIVNEWATIFQLPDNLVNISRFLWSHLVEYDSSQFSVVGYKLVAMLKIKTIEIVHHLVFGHDVIS